MSEQLLFLAAHPLAYPALRLIGRCGPVVRVPGIGVVVNDAALARRVLLDADAFRKSGPGSSGALWTPVLGPSVLLNMDGDAHAALRRKLSGLFTAGAVTGLCERVLAAPLAAASERLAGGGAVDVVELARTCAGAVICALIGLDADEAACRRMYARGEEIAAMVGLSTKELSPRQVATARRVLGEITEPAGRAYDAGDPGTVVGRMRELGLSREEALGAAAAFFLTGTETVASFLPRLVALLCDHRRAGASPADARREPDSRNSRRGQARVARLAGRVPTRWTSSGSTPVASPMASLSCPHHPSSSGTDLDRVIEEALRHTTPSPVMLRSVAAPATIGAVAVRPGDRVLIATHTCTRVPGRGFAPDEPAPDLGRLWFGSGPHFCIGYPLAMAQIRLVAGTILRHAPLRVVRRRYATRVLIPGYRELAVARA